MDRELAALRKWFQRYEGSRGSDTHSSCGRGTVNRSRAVAARAQVCDEHGGFVAASLKADRGAEPTALAQKEMGADPSSRATEESRSLA